MNRARTGQLPELPMAADKADFRSRMRAEVKALDMEYIERSNLGIMENVLALYAFRASGRVFAYYAMGRECATAGIIRAAMELGKTMALPRTRPGGVMDFADAKSGLHPAMYGIPEPDAAATALEPGLQDLILVPCVCCDTAGVRLGQGGGYYDRYLAKYPDAVTACLCRERLLQEKVPAEWNDVRVNFVITEERIIKTGP